MRRQDSNKHPHLDSSVTPSNPPDGFNVVMGTNLKSAVMNILLHGLFAITDTTWLVVSTYIPGAQFAHCANICML